MTFFTGDRKAAGMSIFSVGGNLGFALAPIAALTVVTHYGLDYLPVMMFFALAFLTLLFVYWKKVAIPEMETFGLKKEGGAATPEGARAAMFLLIAAVVMRAWTQFGLISYIPFYYIDYLKGDPLYAGQLLTVFLISGVIGTLAGGHLADHVGHKRLFVISLALSAVVLPLIFVVDGFLLMTVFALLGFFLISSFAVTMVISQRLLPNNVGMASGLIAGFAIGTGGVGVTILGVIADAYGVYFALQSIMILPIAGFLFSLFIKYPHVCKDKTSNA